MQDLIMIGYDQTWQADQAMSVLQQMADESKLDMEDAAVVVRNQDGTATYRTAQPVVPGAGEGAAMGGFWGLLLGGLLAPFTGGTSAAVATLAAGAGLGAAGGALGGALSKEDFDDDFTAQLETLMRPGSSAIVVVLDGTHGDPEPLIQRLRPLGGTVLRTNLTPEAETKLQQALRAPA